MEPDNKWSPNNYKINVTYGGDLSVDTSVLIQLYDLVDLIINDMDSYPDADKIMQRIIKNNT